MFNDGQWELGPTKVKLTDIGKSVFGVDDMVRSETPSMPASRKVN